MSPFLIYTLMSFTACTKSASTDKSATTPNTVQQPIVETKADKQPAVDKYCVFEKAECLPEIPHQDYEGMVCANDGTTRESYCMNQAEGNMVCVRAMAGGQCKNPEAQPFAPLKEMYLVAGEQTYLVYSDQQQPQQHTLVTATETVIASKTETGQATVEFETNFIEPSEIEEENVYHKELVYVAYQPNGTVKAFTKAISVPGQHDIKNVSPAAFVDVPVDSIDSEKLCNRATRDPIRAIKKWNDLYWVQFGGGEGLCANGQESVQAYHDYSDGKVSPLFSFTVDDVPYLIVERDQKERTSYLAISGYGGSWSHWGVSCKVCNDE